MKFSCMHRHIGTAVLAIAAVTLLAAPAGAQTSSDKPIRMIVSIAAGSLTDVIMRAVANELSPRLGQTIVIENRGGAAGIPAGQACAQANPDGQWGTDIVGIPYRGGGPMAQALAAGDIQVGGVGLGNFLGLAEGGKVKVIAVSAPRRSPLVPDVVTFEEAGLGGYPQKGWWGLATPKGTPRPIVDRLNAEFVRLFNDPKFVAFLDKQAVVSAPTTPEAFAAFVQQDRRHAAALFKLANTPPTEYKPEQR